MSIGNVNRRENKWIYSAICTLLIGAPISTWAVDKCNSAVNSSSENSNQRTGDAFLDIEDFRIGPIKDLERSKRDLSDRIETLESKIEKLKSPPEGHRRNRDSSDSSNDFGWSNIFGSLFGSGSAKKKPVREVEKPIKSNPSEDLAKINSYTRELDEAKRELGTVRGKLEEALRGEQARLAKDLSEVLKGKHAPHVRSVLMSDLVKSMPVSKVVTVAVGNSEVAMSGKMQAEVKELITQLLQKRYTIIYDADAGSAATIAQIVGAQGLGITANPTKLNLSKNIIAIENEYLRLMAFSHPENVVMTPDSVIGLGVYVNSKKGDKMSVLDPDSQVGMDLSELPYELKSRDLGASFGELFAFQKGRDLVASSQSRSPKFELVDSPVRPRLSGQINHLPADYIIQTLERSQDIARALNHDLKGAVIFGSGSVDSKSQNLVYQTGRGLGGEGIATRTGGAGGTMRIANQGAFDAGSISVGIPIAGGRVKNEKKVASDVHTMTINTRDYESRIPALLKSTHLAINFPGGNGTMKEIGVTLVKAVAEPNWSGKIVFGDAKYYQSLFEFLTHLPLPKSVKDRIYLLDTSGEIVSLAREIAKKDSSIIQVPQPKARSNRTRYEPESKFSEFD